jgi:hypothetical protein
MQITEVTRRAIVDELALIGISWSGKLEEPDLLQRIFPVKTLPSYDGRYESAYGDIWKHRVMNEDWEDGWIFTDDRFQLLEGSDETFLRFLAETVHPVVRSDPSETATLVTIYNRHLRPDGFELHIAGEISGRPVYGARSLLQSAPAIGPLRERAKVDASYLSQQLTRMEAAVLSDPELAIGTAKELVETVAKTILQHAGQPAGKNDDLPKVVRAAAKVLELDREAVPDAAKAAETIRRLLSNLATISNGLAELRNAYGTGHGRPGGAGGIKPRHARLAVGAAATLATFLLETHESRSSAEDPPVIDA